MNPVRVGVVGVGYLGRFHAEKYAELTDATFVGIADPAPDPAEDVARRLGVPRFDDYTALLDKVDAVSIVVPTELHFAIAMDFIRHGIHVLVEKPITATLQEADALISAAREHDVLLQVGHLERFNAAVTALEGIICQPLFIESHRLAPFKDRGTDVDVILDIMIHDIDIILSLVGAPVTSIQAVGVPVVSPEHNDIANVRLEFAGGCIANVTASRISVKEMRKIRIFQPSAYLSIDYATQQVDVYRKRDATAGEAPQITFEQIPIQKNDSLKMEIQAFLQAVRHRTPPAVPGTAGRDALKVALEIVAQSEDRKKLLHV